MAEPEAFQVSFALPAATTLLAVGVWSAWQGCVSKNYANSIAFALLVLACAALFVLVSMPR